MNIETELANINERLDWVAHQIDNIYSGIEALFEKLEKLEA